MAYRETEHTLAKKADTRLRLLKAARRLVQQGGFAASASAVAKESGVASGTIYRHFPNKSELVAEVFRYATEREVAAVAQACDAQTVEGGKTAADKLTAAVETFAQRALLGRTLVYALIAELVDPRVEQERLRYRFAYAEISEDVSALGIQRVNLLGELSRLLHRNRENSVLNCVLRTTQKCGGFNVRLQAVVMHLASHCKYY